MIAAVKEARELLYGRRNKETSKDNLRVPELCRQKLLHYAESFQEIARSLEKSPNEYIYNNETNYLHSMDRRDVLEERRSIENRMMISHNLCEVAHIMTKLADELFRCRPMDEKDRKLLMHALRAESIYADNFCYLTEKEDDIHAISMNLNTDKKGGCPAAEVADMLSVLLKRSFRPSAVSPYLVEKEPHSFVFMEEAAYVALTGFCKVTKENETVSGDHYSVLESENGKMTLLLSDGTGSGEQASSDSEKALDLMEKLLEAGYDTEAAVNMVNVAFYTGTCDCSHPTLDICDLNLYEGKASFYKTGGAASFLKRKNEAEEIVQGNLPLGIFRNVEVEKIEKQLEDGDYVILMTDGVLDALGDHNYEEAMRQAIAEMPDISPGEMAEKLLEIALRACGGHIRDDMTVLVAGIWENSAN